MTGADGFVGSHVVRLLAERGRAVRGMHRGRGEQRLRALGAEPVVADVLEPDSLRAAVEGADLVIHCAGAVGAPPAGRSWDANAQGPAAVVEAAAAAGIARVVVTSSVLALGFAPRGRPGDERTAVPSRVPLVYPQSKRAGDRAALEAGERLGVDVVVVHPGYVLGPPVDLEANGGSSRVVCQYLRGRLPAVVGGQTNLVDVRDVAEGHVLAGERGKAGQRYILGGHDIAWAELVELIAEISGVRHAVLVLPPAFATAARAGERLGLPGPMPAETLTLMGSDTRFSSHKAESELGYRPRPLEESVRDTVRWCIERQRSSVSEDGDESSMERASRVVERAYEVGLLAPLQGVGQRLGRRVVVGAKR